jgi:2,3-dihydroxybenzoate decarboxylase
MFSVDYPIDDNLAGAKFLADYPMDDAVHQQVACENAIRLFGDKIPARLRQAAR